MSKQRVYSGKVINVDTETVVLPNNHEFELEVIQHPGGAAVVALNEHSQICLLRQYRHVAGQWLWELPAGKIDNNEPSLETAQRELAEEAGLLASQWQELGQIYTSPGVFKEIIYIYLARNLKTTNTAHEAEEVIEIQWVEVSEAIKWARNGQIIDAKTLVGLFYLSGQLDPDQ
ncbi:MAG: NUDIX hydrolase [Gammaproteobacteria bacterium]|nr:NUDIX hydrolase [Gammaproteobacteria bacterium]